MKINVLQSSSTVQIDALLAEAIYTNCAHLLGHSYSLIRNNSVEVIYCIALYCIKKSSLT